MLDIIEIDGASNNGVENVRELIEKARFEPNQGKYKVYIIDEVHMLSSGAFNALLKTLEQPPAHVIFILATTEIDKIPETIRSRTLRFDFRKISIDDLIGRMSYVCKEEHIRFEEETLRIIAKAARWGFRDALTLLEQNIIDDTLPIEHVRNTLSLLEDSLIEWCIIAMRDADTASISWFIANIRDKHIEARGFFEQLMYRMRDLMVEHLDDGLFGTYSEMMTILEWAYAHIRSIPDGMMLIELTLLRITKRSVASTIVPTASPIKAPPPPTPKSSTPPPTHPAPMKPSPETIIAPPFPAETMPVMKESPAPKSSSGGTFSYPALIMKVKELQPALTTDLKLARFEIDGTHLTLIFSKKWNYDRVNKPAMKSIIVDSLGTLYGTSWELTCRLSEAHPNVVSDIHEVF